MPNELKPCPFCGGKAEIDDISFGQQKPEYTPFCTNSKCLAFYLGYQDSGLYKTKAKAVAAWNRRANDDAKIAELKAENEAIIRQVQNNVASLVFENGRSKR